MKKLFAICIISLVSVGSVLSQENHPDTIQIGLVVTADSLYPLPNTHVVNKNTLKGTITNDQGWFAVEARKGDTLVFSNISYQYFYLAMTTYPQDTVLIKMKENNFLVEEVSIFSYELSQNENRSMVIEAPLIPRGDQTRSVQKNEPDPFNNPIDFFYELFGKRPKQLRKLKELKNAEKYRERLETSYNRKAVVQITGLSDEELEAFMFFCKYSNAQMNTWNDYQFLLAVRRCYYEYQKINQNSEAPE